MKDFIISAEEIFLPSTDAVVGVRDGVIVFTNPAAVKLLKGDKTGAGASSVFPEHLLDLGHIGCISSASICDTLFTVSHSFFSGIDIYLLAPEYGSVSDDSVRASVVYLRSLLTNLQLASQRLCACAEDYNDERMKKSSCIITHSCQQLRRLILNASVAEAVERDQLSIFPSSVNLAEFFGQLTHTASVFAAEREVTLTFACGTGSFIAFADCALLEQMFMNILSNSLLHTPSGGAIKVSLAVSGKSFVISVDDNGSGIPREILPTVFSKWKSPASLSAVSDGAGLGLFVARGIAVRHSGSMIIESRLGQGTSVRILLPSGEPGAPRLNSQDTGYNSTDTGTVLMHLSTWLPSDTYDGKYDD